MTQSGHERLKIASVQRDPLSGFRRSQITARRSSGKRKNLGRRADDWSIEAVTMGLGHLGRQSLPLVCRWSMIAAPRTQNKLRMSGYARIRSSKRSRHT